MCEKCEDAERCLCECDSSDFFEDSYGTGFCTQCGCQKGPESGSPVLAYVFR